MAFDMLLTHIDRFALDGAKKETPGVPCQLIVSIFLGQMLVERITQKPLNNANNRLIVFIDVVDVTCVIKNDKKVFFCIGLHTYRPMYKYWYICCRLLQQQYQVVMPFPGTPPLPSLAGLEKVP